MRLPATPASAAVLRQELTVALQRARVPQLQLDDIVLVATELVTNAIRHAAPLPDGTLAVSWLHTERGVRLSVTDGGSPEEPKVRHPSPNETGGRGLALVRALASEWGVDDSDGAGTTVWAVLSARADHYDERTDLNSANHA